ncbi:cation:proton antiporter subunit C [Corynebacterium hindlerae]|uniref:Cation:proton antiporter subunit C n=1 Tax=Corynebacterium hindlerae TaxID=699041 RepID=A0A7G5FI65_9CORY|nr:cation:proton antiporter subunit C [Corynebacterium hindlerae]QMV86306.1 cation:proton antiporter subunit C [Corynebacterium hindlerae]
MIITLTIAVLAAGGMYLVLQRGMFRIVLGMSLISHSANLTLLALGIPKWRGEPFSSTPLDVAADPLPQAFVLTAIVISMATTTFMLALAALGRSDDTASKHANEPEAALLITAARNVRPLPADSPRIERNKALEES